MTREEFYNQSEEDMTVPPLSLGHKKHPMSDERLFVLGAKSQRGVDWAQFAQAVLDHIENYTVAQYGDTGADPASSYTPEDAMRSASKYIARFGRNAREGEQHRDFLKLAHYAQIAATKWREQNLRSGGEGTS